MYPFVAALQNEKGSQEAMLRDGQRWLDQAQGQLQNTQVALNDKEAECRKLKLILEQAMERAESLLVSEQARGIDCSAIISCLA